MKCSGSKPRGARSHGEFGDVILSSRTRQRVYIDGEVDAGIVSLGPAGGFSDAIAPAADIIAGLMREASQAAGAFTRTFSPPAPPHPPPAA